MGLTFLLNSIKQRAAVPHLRTDAVAKQTVRASLPPPITSGALDKFELRVSRRLHPFQRLLLQEVADGGFGPGYGIYGVGRYPGLGDTLADVLELVPPEHVDVVPLLEWGGTVWNFIDVESGEIILADEDGEFRLGIGVEEWFAKWTSGEDLFHRLYVNGLPQRGHMGTRMRST